MPVKLSVVVPFFNMEDYLAECLASIANQSMRDLEVIMVDDGSADNGAVIAKDFAARDARFVLVQQDNQGLGPARNTGVRHATGDYLAFADSDDVLPPRAYELLVGSLERSGSDFASGNVLRLDGGRTGQSGLHRGMRAATRTHVTAEPRLLRDRTAWNKVFRRSFWDAHGFRFPAGWYEDSPVTIPAHILATSVDVLTEPVYHWRRRDDSISQGRADAANIRQRITVMSAVRDGLPAGLRTAFDEVLLDIDVKILLQSLPAIPAEDRPELLGLCAALVDTMDPCMVAGRTAGDRLSLSLLHAPEQLFEVLHDRWVDGGFKAVRRNSRWYVDYPFLDRAYDITGEVKPVAKVDWAEWDGDVLRIEGHARFAGLPGAQRARLWLRPSRRLGRLGRFIRVGVPAGWDDDTFTATIDPARLRWLPGEWKLCVKVSAAGLTRKHPVGSLVEEMPGEWTAGGIRVRLVGGPGRFLLLTSRGTASVSPAVWRPVIEEDLLCAGFDPYLDRVALRTSRQWLTGFAAPARSVNRQKSVRR
ncbi:MAG TPA: glycosyltransferase [Streptosporangiaceae bacterium]|nr:glycosyltransferase [Streptosporangiaceae bacterium]